MKLRTKDYRDILLIFVFLSAIVAASGVTVGLLCHKPYAAKSAMGDMLSVALLLIGLGHMGLYRPRTIRQRTVSWLFLFTLALASHAVLHVVHLHSLNAIVVDVIFSAFEASIGTAIMRRLRRQEMKNLTSVADAPSELLVVSE